MTARFLVGAGVLSLFCLGVQAAEKGGGVNFASVGYGEAEREVSVLAQFDTPAAVWLWTDKYVYQPGQSLTLRWTVKPNNDLYPYTIVAYRQNNQTGAKTYLPNGTAEATDIFGNTVQQGFRITRLPEANKQVLIGAGGMFPAGLGTVPNEPGMHTLVVQIRDYTGTRIVKSAYWKIGVVDSFEDLQGDVTADKTLVRTKAYSLKGLVFVKNNATLTIEPGTFILGQPGSQPPSALFVSQNGKIIADGTRSRPIIMTSSQPIGERKPGDWGGLVLLGKAPVNWATGFGYIEGVTESDDTKYGGSDPNHNCGTLRYVRVEFAGSALSPNNEVNGITWGACGKGTITDHVEAKYGFDDNFEWFGGNSDAKYLVSAYPRDDYIDGQIGWTGRLQHVVAVANKEYQGNRGIEMDNNEKDFGAQPLSKPQMYNFTFVGAGDAFTQGVDEGTGVAALWLRRGTGGVYNNMILYNWVSGGFEARDDATLARIDSKDLTANGILMWDNGKLSGKANTVEGQSTSTAAPFLNGQRGEAKNVEVTDPMLRRPLEGSDPDFRPRLGSPVFRANWIQPPDDGFFDQWAAWIGAFGDQDWTEEWSSFHQEDDLKP
ncbi:MAG TPA: hypothetical protein VLE22_07815 [Bryobacteraceae bacterium]|nr:hypothetical protein [Bryobacteraceae bacterium]